ncbi:MAG: hypothetical protein HYV35_11950 [Lentisphaerae bacterium]|nr:hypothetical protein [Lentisphaerota bacterium]
MIERFFGLEKNETGYLPKWLLAVAHSGQWQTEPPPLAFRVDAAAEQDTGVLSLAVDRVSAGEDLVLELTYADAKDQGTLFIGLSSWPEGAEADLFGNIIQGEENIVTRYFEIPIQSLAARYLGVDIYRGSGEIAVFRAALYTRGEFNYWLEQALVEGAVGLEVEPDASRSGERQLHGQSGGGVGAVRAYPAPRGKNRKSTEFLPAEQIATAVKLAADLMIARSVLMTRCVLDGGGGRMTSPNLILESSFGQSSAIGFSYGSGLALNAGFQQGEVERLKAQVILKPEALNINPGILTAFVRLPDGYPASGITSATCDGALYERMMLSDDASEMIIKFRRRDIEAALAEQGEALDIHFVVEGTWQDASGLSYRFEGADSISKIVGGN